MSRPPALADQRGRLEIVCPKCDRRGSYSVARLQDRFGAEATLIAVREELTADCPRRKDY
jgi:hypothetical protein